MAVSNETIINKMMEELLAAKSAVTQHSVMMNHISKVQLLSELLLEEDKENTHINQPSELKNNKVEKIYPSVETTSYNIDDEDGTSIFDF